MTSAQVVETSVKSVNVFSNSPSQDYTPLNDRNLPTYDMTPEFKTLKCRVPLDGRTNDLLTTSEEYDNNSGLTTAAKTLAFVSAGLRLKSPLNTQEAIQIVKATCRRLVRAQFNDCHRRLNYCNDKLQQRLINNLNNSYRLTYSTLY